MARHETAAQARTRMRREGWSEKQIEGQFRRWHSPPPPTGARGPVGTAPPKRQKRQPAVTGTYKDRTPIPLLHPAERPQLGGAAATQWAAEARTPSWDVQPQKRPPPPPRYTLPAGGINASGKPVVMAPPPPPPPTNDAYRRQQNWRTAVARQEAVNPTWVHKTIARTAGPESRWQMQHRGEIDPASLARYQKAHPPGLLERAAGAIAHGAESTWDAYRNEVSQFTGGVSAAGRGQSLTAGEQQATRSLMNPIVTPISAGLEVGGMGARAAARLAENYSGGLSAAGQGRSLTQSQQEAALVPQQLLEGPAKVLVAGGAAVPGAVAHPLRAAKQGAEILRGAGAAFIAVPALMAMGPTKGRAFARQMVLDQWRDIVHRYGPNTSYREAAELGFNEPVISALNAAGMISGGAEILAVTNYLKAGASLADAIRLARDPSLARDLGIPYKPRTLTVRGEEITPYQVELSQSRSPGGRRLQQGYDLASRGVERVPRIGPRLPISSTRRALRVQARRLGVRERHLMALAHSLWHDVHHYLKENPEQGSRLFYALQKPADIPEDVWLKAIHKDLQQMLEGRPIRKTKELSAAETRLQQRLDKFRGQVDQATAERWGHKVADLHGEQQRLGYSLLHVGQKLKATEERRAALREQAGAQAVHEGPAVAEGSVRLYQAGETPWSRNRPKAETARRRAGKDAPLRYVDVPRDELRQYGSGGQYRLPAAVEAEAAELTPTAARLQGATYGREMKAVEDDLRTLENQRDELRQQLDDLSVDQAPVESPERTQLAETMDTLPHFTPDRKEHTLRILDARAREWADQQGFDPSEAGRWYGDPSGAALADVQRISEHADLPEGSLAQVRFNLDRALKPEEAAQNLRYTPGGDLHKPHLGLQKNRKIYRKVNGQRVQVLGRITPQEWVKRVLAVVPDRLDRHELATWYEQVAHTFERFFGDNPDAEALLRGFAVSQANASPTSGLGAVLRVWDKIKDHEEIAPDEISAVVKSIEAAINGQHVSKGMAAKLHDFADSIEGKTTRTWMGDDPRGGAPTANDIHAIRDLGYVDRKLVERLLSPESGALYQRGLKRSDFTVDSSGSPGVHQYERMREQYQEITDYLNEIGFDGRSDWKPAEVQALGWSTIQRLHGAYPENLVDAVGHNTRRIALEVTKGLSGIGDDLTLAEATEVAHAVAGTIREMVDETEGLFLDGGFETGVSGKGGNVNASLHFNLIGSPEKVHALTQRLAGAFDQFDVQASRHSSSTGSKPTLIIAHADLADPDKMLALHEELFAINKTKFAGFTSAEMDGVPAIKVVMNGKAVTEASYDTRLGELSDMLDEAVGEVLGEVEYDRHLENTQIIDGKWGGKRGKGKGDQQGLARARSRRALDDPLAAQARKQLEDAVAAARARREEVAPNTTPPRLLNQVRGNQLRGAVSYLDSEDGRRILYLTESADVSTVLHEMIGHGATEMKRWYPDEFASVERLIGRPLEDWTIDDHEWFARMAERYFADGLPPTAELVDSFKHLKGWMREIYGAMRNLAPDLPVELKTLMDTYFGAYNDSNVYRIANLQTRLPDRYAVARSQTLFDVTGQELAQLRRRKDARAYSRSIEGMTERANKLAETPWDEMTDVQQEAYTKLRANILTMKAEQELAKQMRTLRLENRVNELEGALAKPTGQGYEQALGSLRQLSEMREDVLRSVFGDKYDSVFTGRVDLVADWLVSNDLLSQREFERGSAAFAGHRPEGGGKHPRAIKTPARALTTPVVGKTDQSLLGLGKRNNLMRWQEGDLFADPQVVHEAWLNAQAFAFIHSVKEQLWTIGRPLRADEAVPDNVYVINQKGIPIPALQRRSMAPGSVEDIQDALDGLEGMNLSKLEQSADDYVRQVVMTPEGYQAKLAEGIDPFELEIRVVDKAVVDALLRPLRGSGSTVGKGWDALNTLARWSLIYTNPAYIPINFIGNNFFLLAQQGPAAISNLVRAAKMLNSNRKLAIRVGGEVGELPATAAISRGRGGSRRFADAEKKALNVITSIPDRWPRMAAWVYEAKRLGYKTDQQMLELLDGTSEKHVRHRNLVAERATEIMVNFDRLSNWEKMHVTRVLFIWPWIRGATAWPFYYAKEYPVSTSLFANAGAEQERRRQQIMGRVPSWQAGQFPTPGEGQLVKDSKGNWTWKAGRHPSVINVASVSPTSTAAESLEALRANFESMLSGDQVESGLKAFDYLAPQFQFLIELAGSQTSFGQGKSLLEIAEENALSFVPFGPLGQQIIDPSKRSKVYKDHSAEGVIQRRLLRLNPNTVSLNWLNAQASRNDKGATFDEQLRKNIEQSQKDWGALAGSQKDAPYPQYVRKGVVRAAVFSEKVKQEVERKTKKPWGEGGFEPKQSPSTGRWSTKAPLTNYERAQIAYVTLQRYPPFNGHILAPEELLKAANTSSRSTLGDVLMKDYVSGYFDQFNAAPHALRSAAKNKKIGAAIAREREATGLEIPNVLEEQHG